MKCKVIRGCRIGGTIHKPGSWSTLNEPNIIEVDGRDAEVKAYIDSGVLVELKEPKPKSKKED